MEMITNLKLLRMANYGNQTQMAALCGLSLPAYNKVENGIIEPNEEVKTKLESIFNKPINFLLYSTSINELLEKEA
jgi:transcriptional regulator with XRE-family HTH domain